MKKITSTITIQNKKYEYSLTERKDGIIFVECKAANIAQDFPAEDIANLIIDLPDLIIAEKNHNKNQSEVIRFRITHKDKSLIEKKAIQEGYRSVSDYIRHLALQ